MSVSDVKSMGRALRHISDPSARRLFEAMLNNIDLLTRKVAELEAPDAIEWFDLELQNNWVELGNPYTPPQYSKTRDGFVLLRGVIKSGTSTGGTVLFSLPAGFRPQHRLILDTMENGAASRIDVIPNGFVRIQSGGNTYLTLDNIQFQAYR